MPKDGTSCLGSLQVTNKKCSEGLDCVDNKCGKQKDFLHKIDEKFKKVFFFIINKMVKEW